MKCSKARDLIHELMDGTLADRGELDAHLTHCAECRAELRALERIEAAVRRVVEPEVSEEALQRISAGVLPAIAERRRGAAGAFPLRWAAATGTIALAALVVGLAGGRWLWPREVTVTQVVRVPEVRERVVKVAVPVVKIEERVVVKRVPVVKREVVYQLREAAAALSVREAPSEPVKLEPIVIRLATAPMPPSPTVQQEIRPAAVAGEKDDVGPPPAGTGDEASDSATPDAEPQEIASAHSAPRT